MGDSRFARCLQGGGVYVSSGTVSISSCTISGNTAYFVRAHPQKFPSPRWEIALLTCQIRFSPFYWDPILFYQSGVRASHACIMPMAPMGFSHVLHLCLQGGGVFVSSGTVTITSSFIYGNTAFSVRAALMLKSSHRPMGYSRFARCLQGGGVFVDGGSVTIDSCTISGNTAQTVRAHVQKFPSPRVGCLAFVTSIVTSRSPLLAQGANVDVSGGTVCSWATTLTGVFGSVATCSSSPSPPPPPALPSPPPPSAPPPSPSPPSRPP